jgi:hypothetical protein
VSVAAKPEPAKPEPKPATPDVKPEPAKPEPAKPEPVKPDPAPAKPIPTQPNTLPLLRDVTNIPDNGQLRGVLDPGPQAVVNGKIASLEFRLIDSNGKVVYKQLEKEAPFCIAGGDGNRCAPFDTRKLSDGAYTLSLVATLTNGRTQEFRARLNIVNGSGSSATPNAPNATPNASPELEAQPSRQTLTLKASGLDGADRGKDANASGGLAFFLNSQGDRVRFTLPENLAAGRYKVSIRARGQNYKGWPIVELRQDGKPIGQPL